MTAQLVLANVGVRLPNRLLFEGVDWTLYAGNRVALAGRNGSGKSTLLRIMAGTTEPTEGERIVVGKGTKIGFLDQTQLEDAATAFHQGRDRDLSSVEYLAKKLHADEEDHADDRRWEIRKTLGGLGFREVAMEGPMAQLSGGWLLRVFLAGTILDRPDVLLLDEPTNHLDLGSIQWLESFLSRDFPGSLVLVTHDVSLQKRTTESLAAVHGARFFYRKDQKDYLGFRAALGDEGKILKQKIEALGKQAEANHEFARKFKAKAALASRAQSKIKAANILEEEIAELKERLTQVEGTSYDLQFKFRIGKQGGKFPIAMSNAGFRYDESNFIIRHLNFEVPRGKRIAILGDNGGGKTTLLNLIAGRMPLVEGQRVLGHEAEIGYFGQHQIEELDLEASVLDNLRARAPGIPDQRLRAWLGAFGFRGDDEIGKRTRVLSGGEKARLALLRILTSPVNLVLLDEPTNHLDIETKELLKDAIRTFEGTSIFVSHDREFVDAVADRILFVTPDRKWIDYPGTLAEFSLKYPELMGGAVKAKPTSSGSSAAAASAAPKKEVPAISFEERKKLKNRAKTLERSISTAEADIAKQGEEKDRLSAELATTTNAEQQQRLAKRITEIEANVHRQMVEWEKWATELEQIREKVPGL